MRLTGCLHPYTSIVLLILTGWSVMGATHVGVDSRIKKYNDLIKEQPGRSELYLKRAELHRENQHWQLARADYQQARRLPASPEQQLEILFCTGRMQLQAGRPQQALPLLEQVLEHNPGYIRARLNLARTYLALNRPEQAVEQMDRYFALLKRPSPDFYLERARTVQALVPDSYQRVVQGLDEGINALGPIVTLVGKLIEVHLERGDTDKALARFEQLSPVIGSLPKWQAKKGDIYLQAGDRKAADRTYEQALQTVLELPAWRRSTRAMLDLEQYLCGQLKNCRENRKKAGCEASCKS